MALPLIRLASMDSTQTFLRRNPHLGFCGVLAGIQTEGRGRQGNRWESSDRAGLWLSVAIPPPGGIPPGRILQKAMGAAARILDPAGGTLGLKWPNDLVAWKAGRLLKIGGILGEQVGDRLILGLGVNLTAAPDLPGRAIPPGCLTDLGIHGGDPGLLAKAILIVWQNLEFEFQPAFYWPAPGQALRWEGGAGTCLGWEPDGRLRVATASGVQRLSVGEVSGLA